MSSKCFDWSDSPVGPFGIDYLYFYHCQCHGFEIIAAWVLVVWVVYLINIVGTTASNYFSPTLSSICKKLKVRYDIAGVTFLAFGNGAPDVFSSISSFSGSADVDIGIGSILGGSVFVSSIVVGAVAMACPTEVTPKYFVRDIVFHILAVSSLTLVGSLGYTNIWIALSLFVVYGTYVAIVLTSTGKATFTSRTNQTYTSSIQTAFWHPSPSAKKKQQRKINRFGRDDQYESFDSIQSTTTAQYQFLTLHDSESASGSKNAYSDSMNTLDDGEITIDLFGAGGGTEFEGLIVEDYIPNQNVYSSLNENKTSHVIAPPFIDSTKVPEPTYSAIDGVQPFEIDPESSTLTTKLLPTDNDESSFVKRPSKNPNHTALASFYWQQQALSNRMRKSLNISHSEWIELSLFRRVWIMLEFPAVLARDLTIPTLDPASWNKYYALLQPIASLVFLNYLTGYSGSNVQGSSLPEPVFWILIALPVSGLVYLFTHFNKPPQDVILSNVWNLCAFAMSIAWIYTLSKELVVCLASMGQAFNVPAGFLGLTVLAWGNSIGDLISNTAIARQGLGEMALAGCYGGPVFNLLIGLGLSFGYVSSQSYPSSFKLQLDISSIVSLVFLYCSLISTLTIVWWRGFKLEKWLGYYLWSLYLVYNISQIAVLIFSR